MFTKALAEDRGNLVSARSLADIYLSRGERLEAVKKYKLYRAISGDRSVEEVIERIEKEMSPAPEPPAEPRGRVLADLYFAQGHYAEALALYREMSRLDPSDGEIARLVAAAHLRLSPGLSPAAQPGEAQVPQAHLSPAPDASSASPDRNGARRQARIQALKRWLSVIQGR